MCAHTSGWVGPHDGHNNQFEVNLKAFSVLNNKKKENKFTQKDEEKSVDYFWHRKMTGM